MPNTESKVLSCNLGIPSSTNRVLQSSDVKRLCMLHFTSAVLPELQKFRKHLESQGYKIDNRFERRPEQDHLRAQLLIEYPPRSVNVLDMCYQYSNQYLVILGLLGEKATDISYHISFADLNEITAVEVYEIIEAFVTTAFNELSLCEFVTDEEDEAV
jgi:hypothetical protein